MFVSRFWRTPRQFHRNAFSCYYRSRLLSLFSFDDCNMPCTRIKHVFQFCLHSFYYVIYLQSKASIFPLLFAGLFFLFHSCWLRIRTVFARFFCVGSRHTTRSQKNSQFVAFEMQKFKWFLSFWQNLRPIHSGQSYTNTRQFMSYFRIHASTHKKNNRAQW